MDDVESLERATLAAVPPREQQELSGWLLGLDDGTVGRSHSAAPLVHRAPEDTGVLDAIAQRYRAAGLSPLFRLPRVASFDAVRLALQGRGFAPSKPTLVQIGSSEAMAQLPGAMRVSLDASPTDRWAEVFLGEGFDPVDGASRLAILRRARESVFASVEVEGRLAAVGSACFAHGWCGVHGMRTLPAFRGRGLAASILAALANQARRRGLTRAYLQVEAANEKAQALYRRAGFETAWAYEYWREEA